MPNFGHATGPGRIDCAWGRSWSRVCLPVNVPNGLGAGVWPCAEGAERVGSGQLTWDEEAAATDARAAPAARSIASGGTTTSTVVPSPARDVTW